MSQSFPVNKHVDLLLAWTCFFSMPYMYRSTLGTGVPRSYESPCPGPYVGPRGGGGRFLEARYPSKERQRISLGSVPYRLDIRSVIRPNLHHMRP